MSAELIFKTTTPKALEWWAAVEAARDAAHELRRAYGAKMTEEFGPTPKPFYGYQNKEQEFYDSRQLMTRSHLVAGLHSGYSEVPPADSGWRLDSKDKYWAPKLATKEGKLRAKELSALSSFNVRSNLSDIGVAQRVWEDSHIYSPGIEHDKEENALYVTWASYSALKEAKAVMDSVPEVVWEEIQRSVWYAREEAKPKPEQ